MNFKNDGNDFIRKGMLVTFGRSTVMSQFVHGEYFDERFCLLFYVNECRRLT